MWMSLLVRNWRLIAFAALIVAALLAIRSYGHRCDQSGYERAREEMAEAVRKAEEATRTAEAKAREITEAKDREWQTERKTLEGRVTDLLARPAPAIRLCKSAGGGEVPSTAGPASQPDGAATDRGPAVSTGGDIRRPLVLYGGECERTRAQLTALQAWIREQGAKTLSPPLQRSRTPESSF